MTGRISDHDKTYRRAGHVSWCQDHLMLAWGGVVEHRYTKPKGPNRSPSCGNSFHDPSILITYDPMSQHWSQICTSGDVPPPTSAPSATLSSADNLLYVYGGMVLVEQLGYWMVETSNLLYTLDVEQRKWKQLQPVETNSKPPPAEKGVCWEYNGDIFMFGGYCDEVGRVNTSDQFQVTEDHHSGGAWTNHLIIYRPNQNKYIQPCTKGSPPSPRAASASCVIDDKVYIFGGRCKQRRLNDLHSLDLKTMTWTQMDEGSNPDPFAPPSPSHPSPRSIHTMVNIGSNRMAVYGGLGQLCAPLNDCWILDIQEDDHHWWELELDYDHGEVRCWHSAAVTQNQEMILHSGFTQEYYLTRMDLDDHPEDVLHLKFGPQSLSRLSLESVANMMENTQQFHDLEILPKNLYQAVMNRITFDGVQPNKNHPKDTEYSRSRLHDGI